MNFYTITRKYLRILFKKINRKIFGDGNCYEIY